MSAVTHLGTLKPKTNEPDVCQAKWAINSLEKMYIFLQSDQLTDIVLISGNDQHKYPAHKIVLSAASDYFHTMFTCNLKESTDSQVVLNEVDGDILSQVVKFCYTGHIDIDEKNVQALFVASNLLQLDFVTEACCSFFISQLDPSNCLGFLMFAERHSCNELISKSQSFINEHFMNVVKHQEFLDLNVDSIIQLLKNENLNVSSEDAVFDALKKWVIFDLNRNEYIPTLLQYIKLPLVTPGFLFENIEPFCANYFDCLKLITEAARWHLVPSKRSLLISFRTKPRKSTLSNVLVIGGIDEKRNVSMTGSICSEVYCPRMDKWTIIYDILTRKSQFSSVIVDDKIYIIGGRLALRAMNTVDCIFNPSSNFEEIRTPMKISRLGLGVAVLDGNIYAVGGYDGWNYLNGVEKFDLTTLNWSYVTAMNNCRGAVAVAVLDGRLYAIGGRDNSTSFRSVEVYNPRTQKWSFVAEMNKSRANAGVAVLNGYIYVVGGLTLNMPQIQRLDSVERYDQHTNTWSYVASISSKRDSVGIGIMGDSLVAVGGYDGEKEQNIVEKYDFIQDKWTSMAPLNIPRAGASVLNEAELKVSSPMKCSICQDH